MTSTLKPHLLIEIIGLQRWMLAPGKLSALFLAYRNFSEAFEFAFRYRCHVCHKGFGIVGKNLTIVTRSGIAFTFNENFHIPILLRIAGRLVHRMDWWCPDESWIEPFLKGIDDNQCLEYISADVGKHFLERYLRNHDGLRTIEVGDFAILDELGAPKIDTLVSKRQSLNKNDKPCRITTIEVGKGLYGTTLNPLNNPQRSLAYDKRGLKHLTVDCKLGFDVAIRMMKNSMKMVEELVFHSVYIPCPGDDKSLEGTLDRLLTYVDKLWAVILGHKGSVSVQAVYQRDMRKSTMFEIENGCRLKLAGYEVSRFFRGFECRMLKESGNKRLAVCGTLVAFL